MIIQYRTIRGFTLIELMITILIIGILATFSYPSFLSSIRKSRRTEAQVAIVELSNAIERYYFSYNTYLGATLGSGGIYPNETNYYLLEMEISDDTTFTLRATAKSGMSQEFDKQVDKYDCTVITLNSRGVKDPADCWPR